MKQTDQGFTLIELLVVIAIIGILSGGIIINAGVSPSSQTEDTAATLSYLLNTAHEKAILTQADIGLSLRENQYQFLVKNDTVWTPSQIKILRLREMPETISLQIDTEANKRIEDMKERQAALEAEQTFDQENDGTTAEPQIYFLSTAEILPRFTIRVTNVQDSNITYAIGLNEDGEFSYAKE